MEKVSGHLCRADGAGGRLSKAVIWEDKMMVNKSYRVSGMGCEACVSRIVKAVLSLDGVEKASADLVSASLSVMYEENKLSFKELQQAVDHAGYVLAEQ